MWSKLAILLNLIPLEKQIASNYFPHVIRIKKKALNLRIFFRDLYQREDKNTDNEIVRKQIVEPLSTQRGHSAKIFQQPNA